ncbi:hypothetical protein QFZ37_002848 [Chryseobacterium ginsenosidimutans]|uniref:hypothetical protein n=1 Tax=Chryseobacterium ginsenosidimutans TaxID=687846 RepID=UPI002780DA92|nr:hypothetical protein [Chryseobacterium ginsenosidimutans]MDQ0594479.1 hypothetical protein [Chryseobacterium ginsenosidimutans]
MDRETFEKDMKQLLEEVLKMAEVYCYNKISCNFNFILSDTNEFEAIIMQRELTA